MYRPTDPQSDLFVAGFQLHPSARRMLERSWASGFRTYILSLLLRFEELLVPLYDAENGRPNWSAARMMGLCILQAWFDLTDRELEQSLGFDVRFQYALDLRPEEAYLSRRSLSDFRLRLVLSDPKGEVLRKVHDAVAKEAIERLGLDISQQRLDSTHVMSNIRTRGRGDLFARTLRRFIEQLDREYSEAMCRLPKDLREWFAEDEEKKWFGKGGERTALRRLAQWAVDLGFGFADDKRVLGWESYFLVARLVAEYCVLEDGGTANAGDEEKEHVCAPKEAKTPQPPTAADIADDKSHEQCTETGAASAPSGRARSGQTSNSTSAPDDNDASVGEGGESAVSSADQPSAHQAAPTVEKVLTRGRSGGHSLQSPHDPDAAYGHKGVGYSVHVAETCENTGLPEIITDFEVRTGADNDWGKSSSVIDRLAERELGPSKMFADAGYPTPQALLDAAEHGVDLRAPVGRPAGTEAVGLEQFRFDEDGRVVACPMGHAPIHHDVRREAGCKEPELHAYFDGDTCRGCPLHGPCAARGRKTGRYRVRIEPRLVARDHALVRQRDPEWWKEYSTRSGAEATMSELKRAHGLGRLRVRGRLRVLLNVALRIIGCNAKRWLIGMESMAPA